jgi:hypothetical protein
MHHKAACLPYRMANGREERHGMVVTMDRGTGVLSHEVAFEGPVVTKSERQERVGFPHRGERHDVAAVVGASDSYERIANEGAQVREFDRAYACRIDFCVLLKHRHRHFFSIAALQQEGAAKRRRSLSGKVTSVTTT